MGGNNHSRVELHRALSAFVHQPDDVQFDEQVEQLATIAKACGTSDAALLDALQEMQARLKSLGDPHPNHQLRAAIDIARALIGYVIAVEVAGANPNRCTELTTRLKAVWYLVSGDATMASAYRVLEPGTVGTAVRRYLEPLGILYEYAADDAGRALVENHALRGLAGMLPKEPGRALVCEALSTVNYAGGKTDRRGKWQVLAELLRSGGVAVAGAESLKQAVSAHEE